MDNVIILRYSEIHLKGKNRAFFENILKNNILAKLSGIDCRAEFSYGRYVVCDYAASDEAVIVKRLKQVFGLFSLSKAKRTSSEPDDIFDAAKEICPAGGTFRVIYLIEELQGPEGYFNDPAYSVEFEIKSDRVWQVVGNEMCIRDSPRWEHYAFCSRLSKCQRPHHSHHGSSA